MAARAVLDRPGCPGLSTSVSQRVGGRYVWSSAWQYDDDVFTWVVCFGFPGDRDDTSERAVASVEQAPSRATSWERLRDALG